MKSAKIVPRSEVASANNPDAFQSTDKLKIVCSLLIEPKDPKTQVPDERSRRFYHTVEVGSSGDADEIPDYSPEYADYLASTWSRLIIDAVDQGRTDCIYSVIKNK